jgi:hypothetical protein
VIWRSADKSRVTSPDRALGLIEVLAFALQIEAAIALAHRYVRDSRYVRDRCKIQFWSGRPFPGRHYHRLPWKDEVLKRITFRLQESSKVL